MASKITGAQVEYDANAPLIDVDTAIEDLAEDLSRSGRRRQLFALQHLCSVAQQAAGQWTVYENETMMASGRPPRQIQSIDRTNRIILLRPLEEEENGPSST